MKNYKTILAALLLGACPAAWAQYSAGTNNLAHTNLTAAYNDFNSAPASPTNDVYLALTRLLALPTNDATAGAFLTGLGIPASGRDVYHWKAKPPTNSNGGLVVPDSLTADQFTAEIRNDIVPEIALSEANLAQITDPTFTLFMPGSVTHFADVTIDYGDVLVMRAILDALEVFGYTIHTANLNAQFGAVSNLVAGNKSVEDVLSTYPGLLTATNTSDLSLARGAFTNAISRYLTASQFIRNTRPAGVKRLFNLDTNEYNAEQNFRTLLTDLESSLRAPFGGPGSDAGVITNAAFHNVISAFTNHTISLSNAFGGQFSLRSVLPTLTTNQFTFIWDTFTNPTLDGVITGLTQTNLGKAFVKLFHAQAQLSLPGVTCAVLSSASSNLQGSLNGVVLGTDGNFYGTVPYGGAYGYGAFFRATASGGFTLLYSFGEVTNMDGSPADGGSPSGLVLGSGNNFYGTTSYGGANYSGTIFMITPNGSLTTLYNFGDGNDYGSSGGNPLLLANGIFYSATQYGGTNGAGIIFQFIPPSGSGANGGNITTLCSLPSSPVQNPYANGSGAGALVQGMDGYFYGVTQFGGDYGGGSLFQFVPAKGASPAQFNTGYSFPQMTDQYGNPIMLGINTPGQASNGVFYGTAQYGGENIQNSSSGEGDGFLFCIDTNGNFTNLYSFDEKNFDGFGPIGALVQGTNGAFYGITSAGGANGDGTIFQFTPGAAPAFLVWFDSALGKQQGSPNGNSPVLGVNYSGTVSEGLIKGAAGTFYGTTPQGGPVKGGNGTVFSLTFNANSPASIVTPPASTTGLLGGNAMLTVSASGTGQLHYLWERQGLALPNNVSGTTTSTLTFTGLTTADAGSYFVVVSNAYGSATSSVVNLSVTTPGILSALQVTITPAAAITAGAMWQVDGGMLQNSGTTVSNLPVGNHTVSFSTIFGWTTPASQTVSVKANSTAKASGTYVVQPGSLTVNISPTAAVTNGAKWQVDGGKLQNSGATVTNLTPGTHQLSFNTISGWVTPANQTVSISNDLTTTASGTYVLQTGSLQVTIGPAAVLASGAEWQVDYGTWQESAATVTNLSVGNHTVSFRGIDYWGAPSNQTVSIKANSVTKGAGNYTFNGAGIYNGLFAQADTNVGSSGMLSGLAVTASGTYSGKLLIGDSTNSISGGFNGSGQATNFVQRAANQGGLLTVALQEDWNSTPLVVSGTVSGTNGGPWTANLTAALASSSLGSADYTALLSPAGTPPGYGYLLITNHAGAVTISGALADGTTFNQTVALSGAGVLPVYGNLYGSTGLLLGWLGLESGAPSGNLMWIKEASHSTTLYTNGFTNLAVLQGSAWLPSMRLTNFILPGAQLYLSGGGLTTPLLVNVKVSNTNLVASPAVANFKSASINTNTGQLTVTFTNGFVRTGLGAALQNAVPGVGVAGGGFFLMSPSASSTSNPTNAGSITLITPFQASGAAGGP